MTAPARHSLPRLVAVVLGAATLSASALALPVPPSWLQDSRPAEVAGLYWMVAPDMPSALLLAPAREFTYLRLAPDGKSRLENITVDATRERVAPSTEVTAWSTMPWRVRGAAGSDPAELCWQLGATLQCHPYRRDVASGDLTLYRSRTDGRVDLILRRASPR